MTREAFTLIELLFVMVIIAVLAGIFLPSGGRKEMARRAGCSANLRNIGASFAMYLDDSDNLFPDRRDLKSSLPGGYRPWTVWPPSDPRAGWGGVVLSNYIPPQVWLCPSAKRGNWQRVVQVGQPFSGQTEYPSAFWMWRFDRPDDPVPLDNFWGKTPETALANLREAQNPQAANPQAFSDVELVTDPYFPRTIPSVTAALRGKAIHPGGRNRLFMDGHVEYTRDPRLN